MRKSVSYVWESTQDALEFWTQFLRSEASETLTAVWHDAKPEIEEFIDDLQSVFYSVSYRHKKAYSSNANYLFYITLATLSQFKIICTISRKFSTILTTQTIFF